jgi:hypothetical protein
MIVVEEVGMVVAEADGAEVGRLGRRMGTCGEDVPE